LFEEGGSGLFEHDLNTPLLEALDFTAPAQTEYELLPESTGFLIYDDFVGEQINLLSPSNGRINLYAPDQPNNGQYCLYWTEAEQYNTIAFDFSPNKDFSQLVEDDYFLSLLIRGTDPSLRFDIRWVDTDMGADDLPWRMGVTIDNEAAPFDRRWHILRIPLSSFVEQGAWDGEWHEPEGKFDWSTIDQLEIVAERQDFGSAQLWFDNIQLTNQDTAQVLDSSVFEEIITALPTPENAETEIGITAYPNPAFESVQIVGKSAQRYNYQLMNTAGQTLKQAAFSEATEVSLVSFKPGMYLLRVTDAQGNFTARRLLIR
ncbi:MAG: T9SS type A sorting domain-containing protein, partial [Bacteroidota bacterium]